jgi:hypothetical protein
MNNSNGGYPSPGYPMSYSGKPEAFSHVNQVGPEYNHASSGERERSVLRRMAPRVKQAFVAAHEGPREKIGEPKRHAIYTPSGKVVAEVHTKHDNEARLRNLEKDRQMKQLREVKLTLSRRFNSRVIQPVHLREIKVPEVLTTAARKAALKDRLEHKYEQANDGHSR